MSISVNAEFLRQLLTESEGTTLEFKRKLYDLDHSDSDIRKRQRDELIKDILALANGSPTTAGDKAYLIIGADDKLQADGTRRLFDVAPEALTKQRILHLVNAACQPRLQDIECEPVEFAGKQMLVITIWPTPHLHETTRELKTTKGQFNEHVVFIRHDENIGVASAKERDAILTLKKVHATHSRTVKPTSFGVVVGGIVGGIMAAAPPNREIRLTGPEKTGRIIAGGIFSAILGGVIGGNFSGFKQAKYEWHFASNRQRVGGLAVALGFIAIASKMYRWAWLAIEQYLGFKNQNS